MKIEDKINELEAEVARLEKAAAELVPKREQLQILKKAYEILKGEDLLTVTEIPPPPSVLARDIDKAVRLVNKVHKWMTYEEIYNQMLADGEKPYKPTLSANLSRAAKDGLIKEHKSKHKVFGALSLSD